MNAPSLVITVRLMEGRFHGEPEWPPSPARVFQALVAGANVTGAIEPAHDRALRWLETLPPPIVAAPRTARGRRTKVWVPNNDLDAKGGDPDAVSSIRTAKMVQPRILDHSVPFHYAWALSDKGHDEKIKGHDEKIKGHDEKIHELALGLFQLGRGVDMAWATATSLDEDELSQLFAEYPGQLFRPTPGPTSSAHVLSCPCPGSMDSLASRYRATLARFTVQGTGRKRTRVFHQPPKVRFARVAYASPPRRVLYALRPLGEPTAFAPTPLSSVVGLVEAVRDVAAARLAEALPARQADIERTLVGRRVDGMPPVPSEKRIRLLPIPSIGHDKVDRAVRRVMVEVPSGPLKPDDVFWAFSGLTLAHVSSAALQVQLTPTDDTSMLDHYGFNSAASARVWRTVTPAALPSRRRRIEPSRRSIEAKGGAERANEDARAAGAVLQALRHAGIRNVPTRVLVQREPFEAKGARVAAFAPGTRFAKERLWHVELEFQQPMSGPIVIGDGRFLGLGVMAPRRDDPGVVAFGIASGLVDDSDPILIASALRRAVMSRYQSAIGGRSLPPFVSGHKGGAPIKGAHLHFVFDPVTRQLLVISPKGPKRKEMATVQQALAHFTELRAGRAGRFVLRWASPAADLFGPSRHWVSRTPYAVDRHTKRTSAKEALRTDLGAACVAAGLPSAEIIVRDVRGIPRVGLCGHAELRFATAVRGPILLGRTRHKGGGLFGHAVP